MDFRYQSYCAAHPTFYDAPTRATAGQQRFIAGRSIPDGWRAGVHEDWTFLAPPVVTRLTQGWKIHASATPDNARMVLDRVWDYCVPRNLGFKFLSDPLTLFLRNAKYTDRGGSGKFVTIYPSACDELERTLRELGARLEGQRGPYILSDARWHEGPLFVRYGGFLDRRVRTADGELVPALETPDGELIPDRRQPVFEVPPWVAVPEFLAPHVAARQAGAGEPPPDDFPYRIERPLHFSNGGGIYVAIDLRSGQQVVLREARPCAGLDASGRDAVQRLVRERDILTKLAGTRVAPRLYEHFTCWEHAFLAEEFIPGQTLGRHFTKQYPLIRADVTDADVARYTAWAIDILDQVRIGLEEVHAAGVAFGDLHPHNILIQPDGRVRFVDFELASDANTPNGAEMGAPGYVADDGRTGVDADRFAFACLTVSMFLPLNALFPLSSSKAVELVNAITERFPVPQDAFTDVLRELQPRSAATRPMFSPSVQGVMTGWADSRIEWLDLRASIAAAVLASATPEREDRLFPGDVEQFSSGGLGIAFGAAGVLHALVRTGIGRFPDHEQWLITAALDDRRAPRIGFYEGLHGVAYVLDELGRRDEALAVIERASNTSLDRLSAALFDGLPGVGLNLLHFAAAAEDAGFRVQAMNIADRLACATDERSQTAGLMRGASGRALFYIRLFEATGDPALLELAATALARDVARCLPAADGSLQLDDGWRVLPYVGHGSAGIGLVLREFLIHRRHEAFAAALERIALAAEAEFVVQSGLFNGRAGLLAFLLSTGGPASTIARHVRRLAWHAVPYRGDVAFPGDQLQRLSMDLATGAAGVLVALHAALTDGDGALLPFFSPRNRTQKGGDCLGFPVEPSGKARVG